MELWEGLKVIRCAKGLVHSRCSTNAHFLPLRLTPPLPPAMAWVSTNLEMQEGKGVAKKEEKQKKKVGVGRRRVEKSYPSETPTSRPLSPEAIESKRGFHIALIRSGWHLKKEQNQNPSGHTESGCMAVNYRSMWLERNLFFCSSCPCGLRAQISSLGLIKAEGICRGCVIFPTFISQVAVWRALDSPQNLRWHFLSLSLWTMRE